MMNNILLIIILIAYVLVLWVDSWKRSRWD